MTSIGLNAPFGTATAAVDSPSLDYQRMADRWRTCRDVVEGSHAIHAAGTRYLPPLAGHNPGSRDDTYWAYNKRALFYSASARTIDGLCGMVFRKPPVIVSPPGSDYLIADIDLMGRSIEEFARALVREVMTTGRAAVLVDHTRPPADPRPYFRLYHAEEIPDVVEDSIGGAVRVVQSRLFETYIAPKGGIGASNEFDTEVVNQVRVLEMIDRLYHQRIYRQTSSNSGYVQDEDVIPTIDAVPINFIPLWVFSSESARASQIAPPPLIDMFEVNLAHYRTEADYRNALHVAGVPTLCVSGMDKPQDEIRVGSAEVFFMPPADAKAYYVSYGADGAAAIRQSLDDLQQMLAFLGARMLTPESRLGIEAAETAAIHRQGEISILSALAGAINIRLSDALKFLMEWALFPASEDASIALNDDYIPATADSATLTAMVGAWQASGISHDSLWKFAQTGELVDPRRTSTEELHLIADEEKLVQKIMPPPLLPAVPPGQPGQPGQPPNPSGANGGTPMGMGTPPKPTPPPKGA